MKTYIILLLGFMPLFLSAQNSRVDDNKSKAAQTYHINFSFASFSDLVFFTASSGDTYYSDYISSNPLPLDLPEGYYNIVAHCNTTHAIYAVLDRFHVYRNMDTTITQASAEHLVLLNMTDENGDIIPDQGKHNANQTNLYFDFGPEYELPVRTFNFPQWWHDSVFISDIPSSMKVRIDRTTVVKKELQYHYYNVVYPDLHAISGDTVLNNTASDLLTFPLIFHNGPASVYYYGWGSGFIYNRRMGGYIPPMIFSLLDVSSPTKRVDTVMLHAMPVSGDSVLAWNSMGIVHVQGSVSNNDLLWSPYLFVNENQKLILSENGYPVCTTDVMVKPGDESHFGSSPPFNMVFTENPPASNFLNFNTYFKGYSNEVRNADIFRSTMQVNQNGQLLFNDTLPSAYINFGLPAAAPCTVIFNNHNYSLYGKPGYLKSTLIMDPSNPVDPDAPTPVSFRVQQGDVVATEIVRGFPCSVSFTAGDYYFDYWRQRFYKPVESVDLYYKEYSDDHWEPLEVAADMANFDSLSGMPYLADLAPVTSIPSDSVWIDLRLEITDPHDNVIIQEIHPAFLLRDVIAGIKKDDLSAMKMYPNPTEKYIFFANKYIDKNYIIHDLQGREMISGRCNASADLSGLESGMYTVSIISREGNVVTTEKVIKR